MGMLLKNLKDIEALQKAIDECKSDVLLKSCDGKETFKMKSILSRYIAIGRLVQDHGDSYEFFCTDKNDEPKLLSFFHELKHS